MAWIREVCEDSVCGTALGLVKGTFVVSWFTTAETEEIFSLKQLALSVMEKSPEFVTESATCEVLKQGQTSALQTVAQNAPPEAIAAGVIAAAEVVCTKAFKYRFTDVLLGACLNLAGC